MEERLTDQQCWELFQQLFPGGLEDPTLVEELAPKGWDESPLVRAFHPTVEQAYDETIRIQENINRLRTHVGRSQNANDDSKGDSPSFNEFKNAFHPQPIEPSEECIDLLGKCLWDIFSDNHEVWTADDNLVDLGSFRGSARFIADFRDRNESWKDQDIRGGSYMDFYMGTALISHRTDLSPIYRLIFRRLHRLGIDWRYKHPRLSLVDLSGLTGQLEEQEGTPEVYQYDPTESYWRDKEHAKRKKEIAEMQEELDDAYRESVEQARTSPPPRTVRAYQQIYGHWPVGWPPHADQED